MQFPSLFAFSMATTVLFASPARAEIIHVSTASLISEFTPIYASAYPEFGADQFYLFTDFFYDTDTWAASGLFSVAGYLNVYDGMAVVSDASTALLSSAPTPAEAAVGSYGIFFSGEDAYGSSFYMNINVNGIDGTHPLSPGSFSIAPYGLTDFGTTSTGYVLFNASETSPVGVSTVSLPPSLSLLGATLIGFGAIGYATRRKTLTMRQVAIQTASASRRSAQARRED